MSTYLCDMLSVETIKLIGLFLVVYVQKGFLVPQTFEPLYGQQLGLNPSLGIQLAR